MAISLTGGFTFKPAKKVTVRNYHKVSGKTYALCIQEEDIFYAHVKMKENDSRLCMPFSPRSYDLKGKTIVFSVNPDERGNIVTHIRSEQKARHFPGLPTQYTPFRNNWIYSGYIVTIDGKKYFDVESTEGHFEQYHTLLDGNNT